MKVTRTAPDAFTIEFQSDQELRDERQTNLSMGGLHLRTAERLAPYSRLTVTLRSAGGGEAAVNATVVATLPDGVALAIEGDGDSVAAELLAAGAARRDDEHTRSAPPSIEPASIDNEAEANEKTQTAWDRIRHLQRMEKILLAVKAERGERALLVQETDPQVLLSLLKNPRLTMEEVVRIAKSTYLTYLIADVIMKTGQWMGNLDVRLALIQNPKTPPPFALRILPTLPDTEVRAIARNATSMALKQAALRRLQS